MATNICLIKIAIMEFDWPIVAIIQMISLFLEQVFLQLEGKLLILHGVCAIVQRRYAVELCRRVIIENNLKVIQT